VRPYSVDCQVPLDAKYYARTCGRFKGIVGQAVTETIVNQFCYQAFQRYLVLGMEVYFVVEQISLLLLPT